MSELNKLAQIERETQCSICTGLYYDPYLLNCGHSFCGGCIINWLGHNKSCPTCREPAIRQPIQDITLQKICDILRPSNVVLDKKFTRADWEVLYPVANQSTFIRDVDQDGTIHRCSNCGWELDEENYCENCRIHYDNGSVVNDNESDYNMQSDAGSHLEEEEEDEELLSFVVDNDQVEYEHLSDSILDDESELQKIELSSSSSVDDSGSGSSSSEDDDEEQQEMQHVSRKNRKRRRIINDSEDEESQLPIVVSDEEPYSYHGNAGDGSEDDEMIEDDSEEEYPEDPFERKRSIYIDDCASEDDDDVAELRPVKVDPLLSSIAKAQANRNTTQSTPIQSDSSSTEDSEDESPDYNL